MISIITVNNFYLIKCKTYMSASQKLTALDINSLLADSNGLALMHF